MFIKYPHLERFGMDGVSGIELGHCYIFPKLDGTNAQVWLDKDQYIQAGSRNRKLSLDNDNAGFLACMADDPEIRRFLEAYPNLRLYGEWLVPHSLKTYRESAWRVFYVFDVFDDEKEVFLSYEYYSDLLDGFDIEVISPLSIIKNPGYDQLIKETEKNTYLINDGKGVGEGIVIKNYEYTNSFGVTTWAKIVTTLFKEKDFKEMGPSILGGTKMIEEEIVDSFVETHLINKTYDKIRIEKEGFGSKNIPELLNRVYHDLVDEEIWDIVKKHKNPTINFKTLYTLTIRKIKALKPELF